MQPSRIAPCPVCKKSSSLDAKNRWRPFCSERCRSMDMGDWLAERHRIPDDEPADAQEKQTI